MKKLTLLVVALLTSLTASADSIELWSGNRVKDIEIIGVKEGKLQFRSEGKLRKVSVTKVRNVVHGSEDYQIVRFVDYTHKKRKAKLLTIRVEEAEKPRIHRPLVRLFSCIKNTRGAYEITMNVNARVTDPTNAGGLDDVDAADFLNRHYLLDKPEGLAFRVELWQGGTLQVAKNYGNEDKQLAADWYRRYPIKTTRTIKVANEVIGANEMAELEKETNTEGVEKGWEVDSVSVLPEVLDTIPRLKIDYSIYKKSENSTVAPRVIFYYVTENKKGNKEIASVKLSSDGGKEVKLVAGRYKGSVKKKLPGKLRLTKLETTKEPGLIQLIHWRVELVRGDDVLAFKEKSGSMKKQLPDGWWK